MLVVEGIGSMPVNCRCGDGRCCGYPPVVFGARARDGRPVVYPSDAREVELSRLLNFTLFRKKLLERGGLLTGGICPVCEARIQDKAEYQSHLSLECECLQTEMLDLLDTRQREAGERTLLAIEMPFTNLLSIGYNAVDAARQFEEMCRVVHDWIQKHRVAGEEAYAGVASRWKSMYGGC
jgi:hypothetical protein